MNKNINIIKLFEQITNIPRCSGTFEPFINFMKQYAKKYNYDIGIDNANNIVCYKKNKKVTLCLQSHYDIVCLNDNETPKPLYKDDLIYTKNSTLGADNGIGCAYMLALMQKDYELEFLFTADEEVGLIGASNITLDINAKFMLNLDSEEQGVVCIGCAGGIDIFGYNKNGKYIENYDNKSLYEIEIKDLQGGHSGVDIDKNIPNALELIVNIIKKCDGELLDINGGERINSIAKYAKAIILSNIKPCSNNKNITITKIDDGTRHYKQLDPNILNFLYQFKNGVLEYNDKLKCVQTSINLAIIKNKPDGLYIELSARSMDSEKLEELKSKIKDDLCKYDFKVTTNGKYTPWKPKQNNFIDIVHKIYKQHIKDVKLEAIHAGLECAILKEKYPNIEVCSIGPNIHNPHSFNERCEISSVLKVYEILKDICKNIKKEENDKKYHR